MNRAIQPAEVKCVEQFLWTAPSRVDNLSLPLGGMSTILVR